MLRNHESAGGRLEREIGRSSVCAMNPHCFTRGDISQESGVNSGALYFSPHTQNSKFAFA